MSYSGSRYSSSYQPYSAYEPLPPPPDLQPLLSALSGVLLVVFVAYCSASYLGLSDRLTNLAQMAQLGISSLLGSGGRAKVDWAMGGGEDGEGLKKAVEGTGRIIRRYRETKEGANKAAGGGRHYPGLLNAAGNLCFLNATLQSMASLPSLLAYLDSLSTTAYELHVPSAVTDSLLDTLTALNTPSTSRPAPLRPLELANALAASSPSRRRLLASSDQQDAHELWGMIRDAVEEEADKVVDAQERASQAGSGLAEVAKLRDGLGMALSRKKTTRRGRNDPWFFLRSQRVKCMTCGYVRDTRHEGEELLMLQVPPVAHCSLYDLLGEYTKPDMISGYNCRKCAMVATLAKLEAQRDRLSLPAGSSSTSSPGSASPSPAVPPNPFDLPPEPAKNGNAEKKMTASRKERRRKAQKLVERVQAAVEASDFERDLGEDVKMDRAESAAAKVVRFARTPDILLLHLNRSGHYGYAGPIKNTCNVSFPEYLDISSFCDGGAPHPSPSSASPSAPRDLYRLFSLVVHYGSHSFGHYVAFRRRPVDPSSSTSSSSDADAPGSVPLDLPEWYRISDETVDPSSITEALRANPFLLFYERVRPGDVSASAASFSDAGEGPVAGSAVGAAVGAAAAGLAQLDKLVNGAQARVVESWRVAARPPQAPKEAVERKEEPREAEGE
ncbi:hypothetical protein JCM8097_009290 [Rhodosporidiobolus ruineniae]